jgi:hypothetical protein
MHAQMDQWGVPLSSPDLAASCRSRRRTLSQVSWSHGSTRLAIVDLDSFSLAAAHKVIAYSALTKAVGMQNLLADGNDTPVLTTPRSSPETQVDDDEGFCGVSRDRVRMLGSPDSPRGCCHRSLS